MKNHLLFFMLGTGLLLIYDEVAATHIRAVDITARRISLTDLTYEITIKGYIDAGSPVAFGDGTVNFDDGNEVLLQQAAKSFIIGETVKTNLPYYVVTAVIEYTFSSQGYYLVSYQEPNRDGIANIDNGVNTSLYVETLIGIDRLIGMNSSPVFQTIPMDQAFVGVKFTHNSWAFDTDGDSLAFKLIRVKKSRYKEVPNYRHPNNPEFYVRSFDYNSANEAGTSPPIFDMDAITGDLTWDAPGNYFNEAGFAEYSIAFIVEEWRQVAGSWKRIGYITRDMLVNVTNGEGFRPDGDVGKDIIIEGLPVINSEVPFSDPDGDPILVETYSELYGLLENPATHSSIPLGFTDGPIRVEFDWSPEQSQLRDRPYLVHFKVTDKPADPNRPSKVTYQTWRIGVPEKDVVVSLHELDESVVRLFPNPTDDFINLELSPAKANAQIFDHIGRLIQHVHTTERVTEINVSGYPPGIYVLKVANKNNLWVKRFIRQ